MTTATRGDLRGALRSALVAGFHPVALSLAYVLSVWLETGTSIFAVGRALVVAVLIALILLLVGSVLFRSATRGGLFASGALAVIVLGRETYLVLTSAIDILPIWQSVLMVVLLAALAGAAFAIARRAAWTLPGADRIARMLDILAGALLLVVVVTGASGGVVGQTLTDIRQGVDLDQAQPRPADPRLPDIYVLFLDGYPRADVLSELYDFENAPFLQQLAERGFAVAPASHSNYTLTQFALVSMFNVALLQDIPELDPVIAGRTPAQPVSRRILNENVVMDALHRYGYTTIGLAGTYEDVALRQADVFLETGHMNEVEWRLVSRTFLVEAVDVLMPNFFRDQQRAFVDEAFEQTKRVANDRNIGPRFMLAHVFAPRSPLVFGPHGEALDLRELRRTEDTAEAARLSLAEFGERLRGQVQYVNRRTIEVIDAILAASDQPPIIIVMSDHGPRSVALEPANPDPRIVHERFGTLFAALTPGKARVFPRDVSPAQIMGLLLQAYFDFPYTAPGSGIYASSGENHHEFTKLGEAPPTPSP